MIIRQLRTSLIREPHNTLILHIKCIQTSAVNFDKKYRTNSEIRASRVRLVNPVTGSLNDKPVILEDLLKKLDRSRFKVIEVQAGKISKSTINTNTTFDVGDSARFTNEYKIRDDDAFSNFIELPLCKVVEIDQSNNTDEETRSRGNHLKSSQQMHKDLRLTWSSTMHDIQYKLEQMRDHMLKRGPGSSLNISMMTKPGKERKRLSQGDKESLINDIQEFICSVPEVNQSSVELKRTEKIKWIGDNSAAFFRINAVKK